MSGVTIERSVVRVDGDVKPVKRLFYSTIDSAWLCHIEIGPLTLEFQDEESADRFWASLVSNDVWVRSDNDAWARPERR